MAIIHFKRQKLESTLMILTLAIALACSCLLIRVYQLSQNRYQGMPTDINAVLGPKSGGIEILLGSLNMESKFHGTVPENLFRTLRAGADVHFEDGTTVSSNNLIEQVIPITFIGTYMSHPVIATDESFFAGLRPNASEIWLGAEVAKINHLQIGDQVTFALRGTLAKKSVSKTLPVGRILISKNNSWDNALYIGNENTENWLNETESLHPVWKNKILNYVLFKMTKSGFEPLKSLINDRTVSQLIWVDDEKQKLAELTGSAEEFGVIIVIVIFALAGFSIFGMMSIRFQTLRISIATLEAIGYPRRYIYGWVIYEALLVSLTASLIAIGLQAVGFLFVKTTLGSTWFIPAAQSATGAWPALILLEGILFSLIGTLISFRQIQKTEIHTELKTG